MTAPVPPPFRLASTRPPQPGLFHLISDQGDRVFLTLLSLNFMLLAFFVVLGTTASVDHSRAAKVRDSVRVAFTHEPTALDHLSRLSVCQALQARVSAEFAPFLPAGLSPVLRNDDRVDLDLPTALLVDTGLADIGDDVAALLRAAPPGYRYGLMLTGDGRAAADAAAALATALIARGVPPQALLVGTDKMADGGLRLSFLLFDGDGDDDDMALTAAVTAGAGQ